MPLATDTLVISRDNNQQFRIFSWALNPVDGSQVAVLVEETSHAMNRNKVMPHVQVLAVPRDKLLELFAVVYTAGQR